MKFELVLNRQKVEGNHEILDMVNMIKAVRSTKSFTELKKNALERKEVEEIMDSC